MSYRGVNPFEVNGTTWQQHARNIASGYGLALQNPTLDHVLWNLTAFPLAKESVVTEQLHKVFRAMAQGWWKR